MGVAPRPVEAGPCGDEQAPPRPSLPGGPNGTKSKSEGVPLAGILARVKPQARSAARGRGLRRWDMAQGAALSGTRHPAPIGPDAASPLAGAPPRRAQKSRETNSSTWLASVEASDGPNAVGT